MLRAVVARSWGPGRSVRAAGSGRARAAAWLLAAAVAAAVLPLAGSPARAGAPWSTDDVRPTAETDAVPHAGDAADDPAVWVDRRDPSRSAVVATDKQGGLLVYDLSGAQLQYLAVGKVNNVDVRSDVAPATSFHLGGEPVSLVTAGNRSRNSIGIYVLEPGDRKLRDVAARAVRPGLEVYGSCMYRSARTGAFYVFVDSKRGQVEQWRLFDDGRGKVDAAKVRSFSVGGQTEGCVADDELGDLYIGQEDRGIWKYGAEPGDGAARTLAAAVGGPLAPDVEGLALAYGPEGTGFLIASSQGDSSYAVYRREGRNAYVKRFRIVRGNGVDSTRETDGIDVSTADLGPGFPHGVFVAQDGRNDGGRRQNFKLVPYQDVVPG